jgi:hypothetical protein
MRIAGPFDLNVRQGVKALAKGPRSCEKSSAASALGRERPDIDAEDHGDPSPVRVELVCQDDTSDFDPFWDGPRLLPVFVAQLIGQTMIDRRDTSATVETAYGSMRFARTALVLDRKS